jgi:hypothetical protein
VAKEKKVPETFLKIVYDYLIENQRILCSGPLEVLYGRGLHSGKLSFPIPPKEERGPILFLSPTARGDAKQLKGLLGPDVSLFLHKAHGELVPERVELRLDGKPFALILQEVACHSYNSIALADGRSILIGSPELLITLYLALGIFTKAGAPYMCRVKKLIDLANRMHKSTAGYFPPFSISCRGYQKGYATLLREKVARIRAAKTKRKTKSKK